MLDYKIVVMKRYVEKLLVDEVFGRQMHFVIGPRQTGKTELALQILKEKSDSNLYFNWDSSEVRSKYRDDT